MYRKYIRIVEAANRGCPIATYDIDVNIVEAADLGYCNLLHFKCAGTRSCELWITGGPIVK
jgi:hypothetical protein